MLIQSIVNMPFNLGKYPFDYMTQQNSLRMSSVPGPKTAMQYGKYTCDAIFAVMPQTGWTFSPAVTFSSIGDTLVVAFITYESCIQDPDDFINILTDKFDYFLQ
jgi:hypothetical protein